MTNGRSLWDLPSPQHGEVALLPVQKLVPRASAPKTSRTQAQLGNRLSGMADSSPAMGLGCTGITAGFSAGLSSLKDLNNGSPFMQVFCTAKTNIKTNF